MTAIGTMHISLIRRQRMTAHQELVYSKNHMIVAQNSRIDSQMKPVIKQLTTTVILKVQAKSIQTRLMITRNKMMSNHSMNTSQ